MINKRSGNILLFTLLLGYLFIVYPILLIILYQYLNRQGTFYKIAETLFFFSNLLFGFILIIQFIFLFSKKMAKWSNWTIGVILMAATIYIPTTHDMPVDYFFEKKLLRNSVDSFEVVQGEVSIKEKVSRNVKYWYTFKYNGKTYTGDKLWDGYGRFNTEVTIYFLANNPNLNIEKEYYERNK